MSDTQHPIRLWYQSFVDPEIHRPYFEILKAHLERIADPATEIGISGIVPPSTHLHRLTEARCARQVLRNALQAEHEGFDGFAIGHFQEGGIADVKSAVDIPVLGLGEAAMHYACLLGHRFGLITIDPIYIPWHEDQIRLHGLEGRAAGVRAVKTSPADYMAAFQDDAARASVVAQFEAAAAPLLASGAEVLIPAGGLPMLLLCSDPELRIGGAPVLNGVSVLLKLAEAAVKLRRTDGIGISRKAGFAKPSPEGLREYLDHP